MNSKATIDDVAAEAGVSRSTVSLVLNNRPVLKPETVEQVRRTIDELGYKAAPPGRRRGQRDRKARATNRIALLAIGIPRAAMNSAVYMDVLHGVEAGVRESGKSFLLVHQPPDEPCPMKIFSQKVDGVVLFGPPDKRLERRLSGTPCVQVMNSIKREGWCDQVTYDNGRIGRIAAEYAIARGHRHAAFISSSRKDFFVERGSEFRDALRAVGGEVMDFTDETLLDETGAVIRVIPERLAALLDQLFAAAKPTTDLQPPTSPHSSPTVLFLASDELAPAVCAELQRRGLDLGKDLDVISCNNEPILLNHLHPRPATIDIHAELIGRKAIEQLLWRIEHRRNPRTTLAMEPCLVEGGDVDSKISVLDPGDKHHED